MGRKIFLSVVITACIMQSSLYVNGMNRISEFLAPFFIVFLFLVYPLVAVVPALLLLPILNALFKKTSAS